MESHIFSIQQMVIITGISAHTLRYYERIGLLNPVGRDSSSGHRSYTDRDIERISFIKKLRATGMPIREVLRYIELLRQGDTTLSARLDLLEQHRQRVEESQREIAQHLEAINTKIEYYKGRYDQYIEPSYACKSTLNFYCGMLRGLRPTRIKDQTPSNAASMAGSDHSAA